MITLWWRSSVRFKGVLLVTLGAALWSTGGLIARHVEADVWTQAAGRGFFGTVTLLTVLVAVHGRRTVSEIASIGWPGAWVGLSCAMASLCFILALPHTSIATIMLIQSTAPVITAVVALLWIGERIGWLGAIAMMVAICGIGMMVGLAPTFDSVTGLLFAAAIALSIAVGTVILRKTRSIDLLPAGCVSTFLLMMVGVWMRVWSEPVAWSDVGWLALFGGVELAGGLLCFIAGARLIPAGQAALLGLLECVLGPVWVWLLLGESISVAHLGGGVLVIAAAVMSIVAANSESRIQFALISFSFVNSGSGSRPAQRP